MSDLIAELLYRWLGDKELATLTTEKKDGAGT